MRAERAREQTRHPVVSATSKVSALNSSHLHLGRRPALALCGPLWPEYPYLLKLTAQYVSGMVDGGDRDLTACDLPCCVLTVLFAEPAKNRDYLE